MRYPVCDDRRTLVWLANQRAVEYHPALVPVDDHRQTHLILDLDPPDDVPPADGFRMAVAAALLVRQALDDAGLSGGVKTSGAKGVHVFVPLTEDAEIPDVAAATRALAARAARLDPAVATTEFVREERGGKVFVDSTRAGGATVVAAYSPRVRPGLPVSFPRDLGRRSSRSGRATSPSLTAVDAAPGAGRGDGAPHAAAGRTWSPRARDPDRRVVAMHEARRRAVSGVRRWSRERSPSPARAGSGPAWARPADVGAKSPAMRQAPSHDCGVGLTGRSHVSPAVGPTHCDGRADSTRPVTRPRRPARTRRRRAAGRCRAASTPRVRPSASG